MQMSPVWQPVVEVGQQFPPSVAGVAQVPGIAEHGKQKFDLQSESSEHLDPFVKPRGTEQIHSATSHSRPGPHCAVSVHAKPDGRSPAQQTLEAPFLTHSPAAHTSLL